MSVNQKTQGNCRFKHCFEKTCKKTFLLKPFNFKLVLHTILDISTYSTWHHSVHVRVRAISIFLTAMANYGKQVIPTKYIPPTKYNPPKSLSEYGSNTIYLTKPSGQWINKQAFFLVQSQNGYFMKQQGWQQSWPHTHSAERCRTTALFLD